MLPLDSNNRYLTEVSHFASFFPVTYSISYSDSQSEQEIAPGNFLLVNIDSNRHTGQISEKCTECFSVLNVNPCPSCMIFMR